MKTNYDDEFDRAQAHEEELQRKLNMSDGVSSPKPSGFTPQGANYYNSFAQGNPQNQNLYPAHPVQHRPGNTAATATAGVVLKVVAVIFYFIALAMLIMMIVVVTHLRSTYDKCTAETTGTVVENVYHPPTNNEGSGAYFPKFEYTVDGKTYRKEGDAGSSPPKYKVGDTDTVHYDPGNPATFYVEKSDTMIMLIMGGISAGFLVFAVIITVAGVKGSRKAKSLIQ